MRWTNGWVLFGSHQPRDPEHLELLPALYISPTGRGNIEVYLHRQPNYAAVLEPEVQPREFLDLMQACRVSNIDDFDAGNGVPWQQIVDWLQTHLEELPKDFRQAFIEVLKYEETYRET